MILTPRKFSKFAADNADQIMNSTRTGMLRTKLNNGKRLDKGEAAWLTYTVNNCTYFKDGVAVLGWKIPFNDVLKKYFVEYSFGDVSVHYATSKTALRKVIGYSGKSKIYEVK